MGFKLTVAFVVCSLTLIFNKSAQSLSFNTTGYENCIFNMVYQESGRTRLTPDLSERTVLSNQGPHLWTILKYTSFQQVEESTLANPPYLKERCSVNIFLPSEDCFPLDLQRILGPRLFSHTSLILVLVGDRAKCPGLQLPFILHMSIPVRIHFVCLMPGDIEIEIAFAYCSSCVRITMELIPNGFSNLKALETWSSAPYFRRRFLEPIAAFLVRNTVPFSLYEVKMCEYLYSNRPSTQRFLIGCSSDLIFMENAAARLNLSIEYIPPEQYLPMAWFLATTTKDFSVVVISERFTWLGYTDPYTYPSFTHEYLVQKLVDQEKLSLFYCTKSKERESVR